MYNSLNIESLKSLPKISFVPSHGGRKSIGIIDRGTFLAKPELKKKRKEEKEEEEEGIRPWKNSRDRERPASFLRGGGLK